MADEIKTNSGAVDTPVRPDSNKVPTLKDRIDATIALRDMEVKFKALEAKNKEYEEALLKINTVKAEEKPKREVPKILQTLGGKWAKDPFEQ